MRTFLRILATLLTLTLLLGLGVLALYFFYPNAPEPETTDVEQVTLSEKGIYHILLAGLDENHENTDTLLLLQFHAESKEVRILSIPRDTMSHVDDRDIKRINAAYNVVEPPDIDRTIEEVEMLTSLVIDRYVITSFTAVEEIVDALGGVKVDVPQDMVYEDPYQDLSINIKAGEQVLDGEESVHFLRYRSGYLEGDLGRVKAQQIFFKAFFDTLLKPSNLTKIPELTQIIHDETETDMTLAEMVWFAKHSQGMDPDEGLSLFILPGRAEYIDEVSYYIPAQDLLLAMLNKEFNPLDKQILAEDLDLVPYATEVVADTGYGTDNTSLQATDPSQGSVAVDPAEEDHRLPLYPNEPAPGPSTGADYGYAGAYTPPAEQTTGQDARDSSTQTLPAPSADPTPEVAQEIPVAQPIDPPAY